MTTQKSQSTSAHQQLMVRVYLSEADAELKPLLNCLHDELQMRGVTVMRGIAGFGASGLVHGSQLIDLAHDLPLVLEFFDSPKRAQEAIARIKQLIEPGHIVSWPVILDTTTDMD
jgi:hypothetical protein